MDNTNSKMEITPKHIEAFLAVRDSGRTNMCDKTAVISIMMEIGYSAEALDFIDTSREEPRVDTIKYIDLIDRVDNYFKTFQTLEGK